jgi:hypothetical protein
MQIGHGSGPSPNAEWLNEHGGNSCKSVWAASLRQGLGGANGGRGLDRFGAESFPIDTCSRRHFDIRRTDAAIFASLMALGAGFVS